MKTKTWIIKRYILEEFATEAKSKKEALENIAQNGSPYSITVLRETAKINKL